MGAYFKQHDPWQHPLSTGHARRVPFFFGDEDWATYIHLEDEADLAAQKYELYHQFAKPVFLGEDRYEQDHGPVRDPVDMRYFQRRLFWSWLLSGGSANYGGRWWAVDPYSRTGLRPSTKPGKNGIRFTTQLRGLDSIRFIRSYFSERQIDLAEFQPNHELARDADADERTLAQQLKVMRRGADEFLIYHPNAAAIGKEARGETNRAARLRIDLRAVWGTFNVEWFRAADGKSVDGETINGGNAIDLTAPWKGYDVVVRLLQNNSPARH
ncbi:MAG: hypothetical protein HY000_06850 [Planctomycetes bacterium]|nr:hypothetical protein [Planctomycetota bacterium]